ncbi:MAG TPA: hypothetical protein VNI52_00505 [Sphingobacteriaceae bacterium]|nr:hypothetical protein [Sphingobacteriaceae bacterium]
MPAPAGLKNRAGVRSSNFIMKDLIWKRAVSGTASGYTYAEVPVKYSSKVTPAVFIRGNGQDTPSKPDDAVLKASFDRLIIYKDKKGTVYQKLISYVPDKAYLLRHKGDISHNRLGKLDKDFDGYIFHKEWSGKMTYILRIENGRVMKTIRFGDNKRKNNLNKVRAQQCDWYDIFYWYQDCVMYNDDPNDVVCGDPYSEYCCTEEYCYDDGVNDEGPMDCSDPAYFGHPDCSTDPDPSPCGYSYSKSGARIKNECMEIINNIKDPCLKALVTSLLDMNLNQKLSEIINNFDNNAIADIYFQDSPETKNFTPANFTNASYNPNTFIFKATVTLSTNILNESSKEFAGAVVIHEVIHGYFSKLEGANELLTKGHQEMADKFITPMAEFLVSEYLMSLKDATALAWSGLGDTKSYSTATNFSYNGGTMTKEELNSIVQAYRFKRNGSPIRDQNNDCN